MKLKIGAAGTKAGTQTIIIKTPHTMSNSLTFSSITIGSKLDVIHWEYTGSGLKARYKIGDRIDTLEYTNAELCKALKSNGSIQSYREGLVSWMLTEIDGERSTLSKFMFFFNPHAESFCKWHEYWLQLKAGYNLRKGAMESVMQSLSKVG